VTLRGFLWSDTGDFEKGGFVGDTDFKERGFESGLDLQVFFFGCW
jgi:hypothetical protein